MQKRYERIVETDGDLTFRNTFGRAEMKRFSLEFSNSIKLVIFKFLTSLKLLPKLNLSRLNLLGHSN